MKKIAAFILFIGVLDSISAQSTLTLDSCRALALSNNKELRISAEKITAAHYEKKAAFTNYLPKIAAIGTYMRTQKEISLLSDEQKGAISQIGIIRKSKFPQNPKRSVRFSGKRTKRSVQKRKARNTQKAETKVL